MKTSWYRVRSFLILHISIPISEEESVYLQDELEFSPTKKSPSKRFGDLNPTMTTYKPKYPDPKGESSNDGETTEKAVCLTFIIVLILMIHVNG